MESLTIKGIHGNFLLNTFSCEMFGLTYAFPNQNGDLIIKARGKNARIYIYFEDDVLCYTYSLMVNEFIETLRERIKPKYLNNKQVITKDDFCVFV